MILGQLRMGARHTIYAPLLISSQTGEQTPKKQGILTMRVTFSANNFFGGKSFIELK